MKQIEQFLSAYFYFNTQEQKGIRGLLVLLFLAIGIRVALAWFEPNQVIRRETVVHFRHQNFRISFKQKKLASLF
jgi:hypothetical protein